MVFSDYVPRGVLVSSRGTVMEYLRMTVIYTNRFVPKGAAGCARGPLIFIRPEKEGDRGLLEHEKVHVYQFWTRGTVFHSLRYMLSKQYRFQCEIEAYAEQAKWYPDDRVAKFAGFIARDYGLNVDQSATEARLRMEMLK